MYIFSVNMEQMHKWKVTSDNVFWFDVIQRNKGKFATINPHGYADLLNEFGIFYTMQH